MAKLSTAKAGLETDLSWTDSIRDATLGVPVDHHADFADRVALRNVWCFDALEGSTFLIARHLRDHRATASGHTSSGRDRAGASC